MSKFWTHPGANYVVNIDHVLYVSVETDIVNNVNFLVFMMLGGHRISCGYHQSGQADIALRAFCEFVGTSPLVSGESWRSMETAPKDGTKILVWEIDSVWLVGWEGNEWSSGEHGHHPTRWRPLPPAPRPEDPPLEST